MNPETVDWLFKTHDTVEIQSDAERWPLSPAEEKELARFEKRLDRRKAVEAQRKAAEKEYSRIEAEYREVFRATEWNCDASCERLELADARKTVAICAWEDQYGFLWPWVYTQETVVPAGFVYPTGTAERLRGERLEKKISRLRVLREAELTIQIDELRRRAA